MYRPKHFKLQDIVPKQIYDNYIDFPYKVWMLFDERILRSADNLVYRFGKMKCNDWIEGGNYQYRGWRPWESKTGAMFSQHKFGRALDLIPLEATVEKVRTTILLSPHDLEFMHITCIEMNVNWIHIDCRNHDKKLNGILKI